MTIEERLDRLERIVLAILDADMKLENRLAEKAIFDRSTRQVLDELRQIEAYHAGQQIGGT